MNPDYYQKWREKFKKSYELLVKYLCGEIHKWHFNQLATQSYREYKNNSIRNLRQGNNLYPNFSQDSITNYYNIIHVIKNRSQLYASECGHVNWYILLIDTYPYY